nr:NADH-plastoquinone oxidoreductase subunit 5 [Paphiopedilum philippinense]YP_010178668.1 NADH-plastoquinone oxidoreductase subunit 5 [Paphiopedilum kolopakingii]QUV74697.1 NADH-plastoquinone oxidoreductase subunit 5 [Paphiopedilum philippinense]QUV74781.1 NADH-plastoquinone oxidoreductase subunit 5 [Paphiopedilum kolopakingii]
MNELLFPLLLPMIKELFIHFFGVWYTQTQSIYEIKIMKEYCLKTST